MTTTGCSVIPAAQALEEAPGANILRLTRLRSTWTAWLHHTRVRDLGVPASPSARCSPHPRSPSGPHGQLEQGTSRCYTRCQDRGRRERKQAYTEGPATSPSAPSMNRCMHGSLPPPHHSLGEQQSASVILDNVSNVSTTALLSDPRSLNLCISNQHSCYSWRLIDTSRPTAPPIHTHAKLQHDRALSFSPSTPSILLPAHQAPRTESQLGAQQPQLAPSSSPRHIRRTARPTTRVATKLVTCSSCSVAERRTHPKRKDEDYRQDRASFALWTSSVCPPSEQLTSRACPTVPLSDRRAIE